MFRVAVCAAQLGVCTGFGLASTGVLVVEGGEVVFCTASALRASRAADIGGVSPLETSGALSSGVGH